jgi:RNase P protein component
MRRLASHLKFGRQVIALIAYDFFACGRVVPRSLILADVRQLIKRQHRESINSILNGYD